MATQTKYKTSNAKGYYMVEFNRSQAEITYSNAGESMIIIDSTAVPDDMREQKVGVALVAKAVEVARSSRVSLGKKAVLLCPFCTSFRVALSIIVRCATHFPAYHVWSKPCELDA